MPARVILQHSTSNLFREKQRVHAYSNTYSAEGGKEVVASVQFASPHPPTTWELSDSPFYVAHPHGADKRIRIVHATDLVHRDNVTISDKQVSGYHLV